MAAPILTAIIRAVGQVAASAAGEKAPDAGGNVGPQYSPTANKAPAGAPSAAAAMGNPAAPVNMIPSGTASGPSPGEGAKPTLGDIYGVQGPRPVSTQNMLDQAVAGGKSFDSVQQPEKPAMDTAYKGESNNYLPDMPKDNKTLENVMAAAKMGSAIGDKIQQFAGGAYPRTGGSGGGGGSYNPTAEGRALQLKRLYGGG
jgi:hypothetical protein